MRASSESWSLLQVGGVRRIAGRAGGLQFVAPLMLLSATLLMILASRMGVPEAPDMELVQMGVGAEDWNDQALINALGKKDGDIAKDVKKQVEEAVKDAQEKTKAAVKEEIEAAAKKGEEAGKQVFSDDIAKYRGQESKMGHSGWIDFTKKAPPQQLHQT